MSSGSGMLPFSLSTCSAMKIETAMESCTILGNDNLALHYFVVAETSYECRHWFCPLWKNIF